MFDILAIKSTRAVIKSIEVHFEFTGSGVGYHEVDMDIVAISYATGIFYCTPRDRARRLVGSLLVISKHVFCHLAQFLEPLLCMDLLYAQQREQQCENDGFLHNCIGLCY